MKISVSTKLFLPIYSHSISLKSKHSQPEVMQKIKDSIIQKLFDGKPFRRGSVKTDGMFELVRKPLFLSPPFTDFVFGKIISEGEGSKITITINPGIKIIFWGLLIFPIINIFNATGFIVTIIFFPLICYMVIVKPLKVTLKTIIKITDSEIIEE